MWILELRYFMFIPRFTRELTVISMLFVERNLGTVLEKVTETATIRVTIVILLFILVEI